MSRKRKHGSAVPYGSIGSQLVLGTVPQPRNDQPKPASVLGSLAVPEPIRLHRFSSSLGTRTDADVSPTVPMRRELQQQKAPFAAGDVAALPACWWPLLPLQSSLSCQQTYSPLAVCITSSRAVWQALKRRKRVVFGTLEWFELVSAYEDGRASAVSLAHWCTYKAQMPSWRVLRRDATGLIGDALPLDQRGRALVGEVLAAWGLQLEHISYGAEVPL